MKEWIASDIILMEPLRIPVITFRMIRREFEKMDNRAIRTFLFTGENLQ
jgi:hypothetical protein